MLILAWLSLEVAFVVHVLLGALPRSEFLGIDPFYTGFLLPCIMALFLVFLSQLTWKSLRTVESALFAALFFSGAYGALQWFGWDPISYGLPFGENRVFSTLGNPNSFAIYLVLHLPLVLLGSRNKWRWGIALLLLSGIAATGSFSILFLAGLFVAGAICHEAGAPKWQYVFCFLFLGMTALQWFLEQVGSGDKYFSIMTRLAIWQEWWQFVVTHPSSLLWGTSQSDTIRFLNDYRSENLLRYIPADRTLLHFHNTWLDMLLQFGVPAFTIAAFTLRNWYRKMSSKAPEIFLWTLGFFVFAGCFHHLEIAHWSVLAFALFARRFPYEGK